MSTLRGRVLQRAHILRVRATLSELREPSFTYKMLELTRIRKELRAHGVREPVFQVNAKDDAQAWAAKLGLRTPELLGTFDRPASIPWAELPDRIVVKPVRGSTSMGVHLLERRGGTLTDVRTGLPRTVQEIVADLDGLAGRGEVSSEVLVERLVDDPRRPGRPPMDYKIMTFFGRIGIIEVKMTGPDITDHHGAWRSFDPRWRPITSPYGDPADRRITAPVHGAELLEMASLVSAAVPRPFLRVDLYEDQHGPVFGEITPLPGGSSLMSRDADRALGRLWEDAELRLKLRAIKAGHLEPADHALPEAFRV